MKQGVRALGVAESYREKRSTFAGVVVRANRVVDGLAFASCTVGGTDATATVCELFDRIDREDLQYLFLSGIAPAWYNILNLAEIYEQCALPTIAISFEESEGLSAAIRSEFDGGECNRRLERYDALPERRELSVGRETLYYRGVGIEESHAREVIRAFTPDGGRPEPLRVARLAARGADEYRRSSHKESG